MVLVFGNPAVAFRGNASEAHSMTILRKMARAAESFALMVARPSWNFESFSWKGLATISGKAQADIESVASANPLPAAAYAN